MSDTPSWLHVHWHNCMCDGRSHAVTDEEFGNGRFKGTGHHEAVCGHLVCIGDSFEPEHQPCDACAAYLRVRRDCFATSQHLKVRRQNRRPRWGSKRRA